MSYRARRRADDEAAREWTGAYRPYDIVKEATIAVAAVLALAVVLTVLFSSPDEKPSTVQSWARTSPIDFVTTAVSELDGTSGTAGYGPPYNHASTGQHEWLLAPQKWLGVSHPLNAGSDFVLTPLRSISGQPALQRAVTMYQTASPARQQAWTSAYAKALGRPGARATAARSISVPSGTYGPVPTMMTGLLRFAQSGGLDGALLTSRQFYQTDYTKPLMLLADGGLLEQRAQADHLLGTQWGMMNETGSYPGQVWLWLYTFWYQIKPFSTSANADILVMTMMALLSLAFVLVPFIPGVSDLPRRLPIYRLIWRDHYRGLKAQPSHPSGLFSYLGLETASVVAGRVRDPKRNVPRSTNLGTLATAVVYMLSLVAVFGIVGDHKLASSTAPFSTAINVMFGGTIWGNVMAAIVIVSGIGALNGWTMVTAEMPRAAAQDGVFPKRFEQLNRRGAPAFGIISSTALASIAMVINYLGGSNGQTVFTTLVLMTGITAAIPYLFSALAQIKWRLADRQAMQTARFARDMIVAVLSVVCSALFIYYSRDTGTSTFVYWAPFLLTGAALVLGIPVYRSQRHRMTEPTQIPPLR